MARVGGPTGTVPSAERPGRTFQQGGPRRRPREPPADIRRIEVTGSFYGPAPGAAAGARPPAGSSGTLVTK
eukprot:gene12018-1777_t